MEVHHHSHSSRKKWTHYLWEFIMLFLAVFCGFLAENQREHFVEHQREKKFAASLYEDLKKDTADINGDIPFWSSQLQRIDTIRTELVKPAAMRNTLLLYRCVAYMRSYNNFEYHDRTIDQLKNAGNFRLIRKAIIADSIIDYDALIKSELRDQEMQSNTIYQALNFLQDKLFNSQFYYLRAYRNISHLDSAFRINPAVFTISADKEDDMFEYFNRLEYYRIMSSFRLNTTKTLLRKAINLIDLLKKEYYLK